IRRHALRNALIPFVTVVAIDAGVLLGGVVVVERVFSWPGLGLLFFDALERSDYPVILAWMAVATVFVVLFNLCADILYAVLDPHRQHLLQPTSAPSTAHWFGTDELSRDSFSRVLHGGQISLEVALGVALLSTVIGVVIGALAGFYRGWLDGLLMRFTDLWIALPALPFLAVAVSIGTVDLGPFGSLDLGGPLGITLLLSCLLWGSVARVVRGATLALR